MGFQFVDFFIDNVDNFIECLIEFIKHWQRARCGYLNLSCLLLIWSFIFKVWSILSKENQWVKVFGLNLMSKINGLNLKIAEYWKDFLNWHWVPISLDSKDVIKTGNILLKIKLNSQWLECHVFDLPIILSLMQTCNGFKGSNLEHEFIHLLHSSVKHQLSWVL